MFVNAFDCYLNISQEVALSIEEVSNHVLCRGGRLIHHQGHQCSSLILVLWKVKLCVVKAAIIFAIGSLQPSVHLSSSTTLLPNTLRTLEENMVASKDLQEWVPIKVLLRPVLSNVITVPVASNHGLPPLLVFASKSLTQIIVFPPAICVHIHVNLEIFIKHIKLAQNTSQVANA